MTKVTLKSLGYHFKYGLWQNKKNPCWPSFERVPSLKVFVDKLYKHAYDTGHHQGRLEIRRGIRIR